MGDMNIYRDFEWPVKLLTSKRKAEFEGCVPQLESFRRRRQTFVDAWTKVHDSEKPGYTFSNMVISSEVGEINDTLKSNTLKRHYL